MVSCNHKNDFILNFTSCHKFGELEAGFSQSAIFESPVSTMGWRWDQIKGRIKRILKSLRRRPREIEREEKE